MERLGRKPHFYLHEVSLLETTFEANQFSIRLAKGVVNNHRVKTGKKGTGNARKTGRRKER